MSSSPFSSSGQASEPQHTSPMPHLSHSPTSSRVFALFSSPRVQKVALGLMYLIAFYLALLIYLQGELLFALLVLVVISSGVYVFSSAKRYRWRYLYSGLLAIGIFIVFPLICTVAIALSNYSGANQLSFSQVKQQFEKQYYSKGKAYGFSLKIVEPADAPSASQSSNQSKNQSSNQVANQALQYALFIEDKASQARYLSAPFALDGQTSELALTATEEAPAQKNAPFKTITLNRKALQAITATLPSGEPLKMRSLREFSQQSPRYHYDDTTRILTDLETQKRYQPNDDIGFFQAIDDAGQFTEERLEPGYVVAIGWRNFVKIFTDKGMQKPLISIFLWTLTFALLSAVFVTFLGMLFAAILQWEPFKGKAIYRLLLILPYAVPSFISILIFKGLFNQSFGEINLILHQLFGIRPEWFNSPFLAKVMLLIVNTWLGYPYMMIVCMGLLKSIPNTLYEASAIEGATPWQNFTRITAPMLLKPLMPLVIATFAFNFNNFVLIQLLTEGNPSMVGTSTPAGHTDLLVSYTYRIAFEGSGTQDFGLAAAIAVIIFILVSILAVAQIRLTKISDT